MLGEKLSVGETFASSMGHALSNIGLAIKVSLPWLITSFVVTSLLIGATGVSLTTQGTLDMPGEAGLGTVILAAVSLFVMIVVASACAVGWHRFVLQGEMPPLIPALDRRAFTYAGMVLALILLGGVLLLIFGTIAALIVPPTDRTAVIMAAIGIDLATFLVLGRMSLVLPAIAVDDVTLNLAESWRWSAGNSWRIIWCLVLAGLVTAVPEWLVGQMVSALPVLAIPSLLLMFVLSALSFAITVGALSEIYRTLTRDVSDAPPHDEADSH